MGCWIPTDCGFGAVMMSGMLETAAATVDGSDDDVACTERRLTTTVDGFSSGGRRAPRTTPRLAGATPSLS